MARPQAEHTLDRLGEPVVDVRIALGEIHRVWGMTTGRRPLRGKVLKAELARAYVRLIRASRQAA